MGSVNDALRDRTIQHAISVLRYGTGTAQDIVKLLNSADADILEKLGARLAGIEERGFDIGKKATARLNAMLDEIAAFNSAIYERIETALTDELTDFATSEAGFHRENLVTSIGADLGTTLPAASRLRAIVTETPMEGRLLASWAKGMETGRMDRITQAVRLGMVQGEGSDKIVARIRGTKAARYEDGVLQISRRSAQAIVRTSVNHVSNVAAQTTWKANEHLVKGWQFLATFDSRTTATCAGLSGQVFPLGEGPIPPRHVNCRSITVAVTKSFRELGVDKDELPVSKRASMDGQVSGDTTFNKWLTMKGTATQDKILGKTRAELFRSGKLDLQDFIKADGTVLTLDQLTAKYGDILS